MRFWMVGCEKPKKSAPDGTMGATGLELKREECLIITRIITMYCYFFYFIFYVFLFKYLYLTDAMTFRRLEWHVRADEATIAL